MGNQCRYRHLQSVSTPSLWPDVLGTPRNVFQVTGDKMEDCHTSLMFLYNLTFNYGEKSFYQHKTCLTLCNKFLFRVMSEIQTVYLNDIEGSFNLYFILFKRMLSSRKSWETVDNYKSLLFGHKTKVLDPFDVVKKMGMTQSIYVYQVLFETSDTSISKTIF